MMIDGMLFQTTQWLMHFFQSTLWDSHPTMNSTGMIQNIDSIIKVSLSTIFWKIDSKAKDEYR